MSKARELLELIEQQGLGGSRVGDGGVDVCVCPECGYEMKHERGVPCNQIECPECGSRMIGKRKSNER